MTPLRLMTVLIVSTALLAGCAPATVDAGPTPIESGPECAAGLVDALQSDVADNYGENADAVSVQEDSTVQFAPHEIDSHIGCRLVISTPAEGSDGVGTQLQLVGIADEDVTETLLELGWTQPFPDTEPFAFQAPDRASGLSVYDLTDPEWIPLDFDRWDEFVDGGYLVIGAPGF